VPLPCWELDDVVTVMLDTPASDCEGPKPFPDAIRPETERGTAPGSEPFAEAPELATPRAEASEYIDDTDMRLASLSEKDDLVVKAGSGRWRYRVLSRFAPG
jgi:hypothetical protein